ncbi:acetyl-CoA C-acetyltransferase [Shimazuella kribbensis]|uniref:acetyl-CoA C-acetyltransferase n=1 Tax=Shimazuella kribbensis TaxID=139808 RepID=UPI000423ADFC|nr:acetyl-CoA C-acetyltransferase [Shimazuella kribbensis]
MSEVVIVDGARTPVGKLGGSLQTLSAVELGAIAIKEALKRSSIDADVVEEVIMGMVLQGGAGQIPSRQAAHLAGVPWHVPTETINKVCASGIRSVTLADQIIRAGGSQLIIAGGMESMSHAPYVLPKARFGQRMGHGEVLDLMIHDGLWCAFEDVHMILHGNTSAKEHQISREEQDAWAFRSHQLATKAIVTGVMSEEIVPVGLKNKKANITISKDESVRSDSSIDKLAQLKAAFTTDGTITAGNAPGVNDGAAAMVISSRNKAEQLELKPLASILGHASVAMEPSHFPITPAYAIQKLLSQHSLQLSDIDLFEINEAFAAVTLATAKMLGISKSRINVNGGAVALGHPIGASGARILLTLAYELRRRGGGLGIAAICSGAGQGDAVLIEV